MEFRIALQPKQKLFRDSLENYPVTLFGGAKGGGKSYSLRNIFLIRCFETPKTNAAIFRKTYPELEANHIRPLFQEHPSLREYWSESKKLLTLPNGSTLQFSHCAGEKDVVLYQGREITDLGIDEAGQWSETMFRTLLGSNRSSIPTVKARCALTGNPGGIGHGWLKRIFIEKRMKEFERIQDYNFIQALVSDNYALIEADPDYVHRLDTEPNQALRRAYRFGDWDIFAGQFYSELTRDIHLVRPFSIPNHWNRFGSYDYGFNHPAAFGWFAIDEDGNVYLYRELVASQHRVDQFCRILNQYSDTSLLYPIVAGRDCWTQRSVLREDAQPPTIAEEFLTHGISLKPAVIDRIQGAAQLRSYLAWQDKVNKKSRLYIFDTCPITFDTINRMVHDPDNVEDVLKVDATEGDAMSGDDAYDMIRYGLMSRPAITDPPKPVIPIGSLAWYQEQNKDHFEKALEHYQKQKDDTFNDF